MQHYSPEGWFGYLRNTIASELKKEMDQHIDSGCRRCKASISFWSRVLVLATRERQTEEPSAELIQAVTTDVLLPVWRPRLRENFSLGRLIFNSFLQPALAPVRASALMGPQLVFESGPFVIDLQLTAEPGRPHNFLTGQILMDESPNLLPAGVHVALYCQSSLVTGVDVSEFGEFDFDISLRRTLSLQFTIPGQEGIEIQIPDFVGQ